jgi:hypothetical protein
MFFSLDVLRAHKGDCLMLHYGKEGDHHLVLIDGGPSDVYKPQLKPRLARVHDALELEEGTPLPVDIVMVSHIDDDHIKGILDLTKEQRSSPELRLAVRSFWFNSFDDVLSTTPGELKVGTATASVLAGLDDATALEGLEAQDEDEHQTLEVLSSVPQGRTLRDDAAVLGWKSNREFDGKLILVSKTSKAVTLNGGLKLTVAGPMQPELLELQKAHDDFLRNQKAGEKTTPEAALAAFVDNSVPNLSSIVVLAELGGKKMLLTGDARGDKILEGLEMAGLLDKGGNTHIDLLKVPHHGSDNNMEPIFFKRLPADHYVFSGDGEHGNPERTTLGMLLEGRGEDADYTIHLTYPIDEIDVGRKADWEKEQAKEKKRQQKNPAAKVRKDWSPAENSLKAFFAAHPKMLKKVKIVEDAKPHLIDLLDAVKI